MPYKIFTTPEFERKLAAAEKSFQDWAKKIAGQLIENPFVGKPLGRRWFREKKFGKYRIYFLVYESLTSVYIVNISQKKNQQEIINTVWRLLEVYQKEVEELNKEKI